MLFRPAVFSKGFGSRNCRRAIASNSRGKTACSPEPAVTHTSPFELMNSHIEWPPCFETYGERKNVDESCEFVSYSPNLA